MLSYVEREIPVDYNVYGCLLFLQKKNGVFIYDKKMGR